MTAYTNVSWAINRRSPPPQWWSRDSSALPYTAAFSVGVAAVAIGVLVAQFTLAATVGVLSIAIMFAASVLIKRYAISPWLALFGIGAAALYVVPPTLSFFYGSNAQPFRVLGVLLVLLAVAWLLSDGDARVHLTRWTRIVNVRRFFFGIAVLALSGLVVAFIRSNVIGWVASDVLRLGISAFGIAFGATMHRERVRQFLVVAGVTLIAIDLCLLFAYVANFAVGEYERMGGGSAAGLALGLMFLNESTRRAQRLGALTLAIESALMALSLTRGLWVAGVVVMSMASVLHGRRVRRLFLLLLTLVALLVVVLPTDDAAVSSAIARRIDTTLHQRGDEESIARRFDETKAAWMSLRSMSGGLEFGAGLGATYIGPDGENTHHIHNTFVSSLFRHGFGGMFLVGVAYFYCLALAVRNTATGPHCPVGVWAVVMIFATCMLSMASYVLIGELLPAIAIGWLLRPSGGAWWN